MTPIDPTPHPKPHPRRCTAHKSNGDPCGRWAIAGGTVCPAHGGSSPVVKRAAQARLLEQVAPSIAALVRVRDNGEDSDVIRAANSLLDRAGIVRRDTPAADAVYELVADRLRQLRDQGRLELPE